MRRSPDTTTCRTRSTSLGSRFRRKHYATSAAVCAAALVLAAGCAKSSDAKADPAGKAARNPADITIAYVPGVSNLPYFDTAFRGAATEAKKYGYQVKYVPVTAYDATAQTNALNAELAAKPDFLLVSAVDDVSVRPAVQRYLNAGIPVIAVGGTLRDSTGLFAQIATDNYQGGKLVAESLGKELGGKGTVATIDIAPGASTIDDRVRGFQDTMRIKYPGVKVLTRVYGGGTVPSNQTELRSLILAHPDINAVFGATEVNAEGASAALAAIGKTGKVRVAGFDASPEEVKQLKAGHIDFLSVSQPAAQLAQSIDLVHAYLSGDKSTRALKLVPNIAVTRDNVDDPKITPILYTAGT